MGRVYARLPLLTLVASMMLADSVGNTAGAPGAFGAWSFRAVNGPAGTGDWMPAVVPGCVHTDLLRAKKIPDPFYGTNEKDLQWIEHTDWEYRSTLDADAALLAHEHVDLVFHGLDTYAEVLINGAPVLTADNMFRTYRVDARPRLT